MSEVLLSPREKKLLRRLAQGMTDRAIAVSIGGRADQVRAQRARLLAKLQINSHAEVVTAAERFAPYPSAVNRRAYAAEVGGSAD